MTISKRFFVALITIAAFSAFNHKSEPAMVQKGFNRGEELYSEIIKTEKNFHRFPKTATPEGKLVSSGLKGWTSGFWAGNLWYLYEYTGKAQWKEAALKWTHTLQKNQYNTSTHDLGFMMYCSYGNAYRLTQNPEYEKILIQSAKSLATRFNPITKTIKSWDKRESWDGKTVWHYPVIIDNLMNLELLFWATKVTGDSSFYQLAVTHAETTMKNHVRPDYSTYHVVNYDEKTGAVLNRETCQGYADNSTWARGQAWAIYGYTMIYRETKDKKFLELARRLTDFYLNHDQLPKDKVPYWDFNVNQEGYQPQWAYDRNKYSNPIPRDASSAAIVSSALLELSEIVTGKESARYKKAATDMLVSLSSSAYLAEPHSKNNFLIKHSVGSLPHGAEIDAPLAYADYYYLEALLRLKQLSEKKKI